MTVQQAHEEWRISTRVVSMGDGSAVVEVDLNNGRVGALPSFNIQVDLHPGMETVDVRLLVLNILAAGARGLTDEAVAEGARLLRENP